MRKHVNLQGLRRSSPEMVATSRPTSPSTVWATHHCHARSDDERSSAISRGGKVQETTTFPPSLVHCDNVYDVHYIPTHLSQLLSHGIAGLKSADKTRKWSRSSKRSFAVRPSAESCAAHPTTEPLTKMATTRRRADLRNFIDNARTNNHGWINTVRIIKTQTTYSFVVLPNNIFVYWTKVTWPPVA